MGHRLSKIYTRTGDAGTTGLGDGARVDKDDPRVEAYGQLDALNSVIGQVLAHELPEDIRQCLVDIQHDLFDIGGEICMPGHSFVTDDYAARLEAILDRLNDDLEPLSEFILPGGTAAAAACHFARTACRTAERRLVSLHHREPVSGASLKYLNRLSDLLFVVARTINKRQGHGDVLWEKARNRRG